MSLNFDLFAGFKTDDIKRELDALREELMARQGMYQDQFLALEAAMADLSKMEEKASFVVTQLEQMQAITTPPDAIAAEHRADQMAETSLATLMGGAAFGGLGLTMMVGGGLTPGVLKVIGKAPGLKSAAALGKSSKFAKVFRMGSKIAGIGAALAVIDVVLRMVSAQKINDELREHKDELENSIDEADAVIEEVGAARKEAEDKVNELLAEAEISHLERGPAMEAYVRKLNEAIAGLSAAKSKARIMRNMLVMGQPADQVAFMSGADLAAVENIAIRVEVEKASLSGRSAVEIAREMGLAPGRVKEMVDVLKARGEAIAGEDPEAVAEALGIPASVVVEEGEEAIPALGFTWEQIEQDGDLDTIGARVLVPVSALERLRHELQAKTELVSGADLAAVAEKAGRTVEKVSDWNVAVAEARRRVALLKKADQLRNASQIAARLRLPIALVA